MLAMFFNPFGFDALFKMVMDWTGSYWITDAIFYGIAALFLGLYFLVNKKPTNDTAMKEYFENVSPNYQLDYSNIHEKTGLDCAKWLINHFYDTHPEYLEQSRGEKKRSLYFPFPHVYVHSANPIGSANIMGYVNNFLMNEAQPQDCVRVQIEHTV